MPLSSLSIKKRQKSAVQDSSLLPRVICFHPLLIHPQCVLTPGWGGQGPSHPGHGPLSLRTGPATVGPDMEVVGSSHSRTYVPPPPPHPPPSLRVSGRAKDPQRRWKLDDPVCPQAWAPVHAKPFQTFFFPLIGSVPLRIHPDQPVGQLLSRAAWSSLHLHLGSLVLL